jgi:hypothetical protein
MESHEMELITMRFDVVTSLMTSQFKGVNERLDKINGRVGKTEDEIQMALVERSGNRQKQEYYFKNIDELSEKVDQIDVKERNHASLCPVVPKLSDIDKRVRSLEEGSLITLTKKRLIISIVATLSALIGLAVGTIQINESLRSKETTKIMKQSDSILFNQILIYEAAKDLKNATKANTVSPELNVNRK